MAPARDFGPIVVAYVAAIAAALLTLFLVPLPAPWDAAAADVVATFVVFGFSLRCRNSSVYDPYWSVIPPLLAVWWMVDQPESVRDPRVWMMLGLTWFWGIRLTANWSIHWGGMGHEDWRYPIVRERAGRFGTLADLLGIHLFPTFQVFLGCLPIYVATVSPGRPLGALDALAFVVTFGAVVVEMVADLQLHAFLERRAPGQLIDEGLWSWSRHPNYFGEASFWVGLMLFGLAAAPEAWRWVVPGASAIAIMFVVVSIPFMDQRSLERRPAYADYVRRVSALIPLPPKR